MKQLKLNLMLLLTALIWGASFVAQKQGSESVGPFTFNGIRLILAVITLIPVILIMDKKRKEKGLIKEKTEEEKKEERAVLIKGGIACGVFLCIGSTLQQFGIEFTTAGKAGFITSLYVVLVPLLGIFLGKKVRPLVWFCVVAAAVGLYLLTIKPGTFKLGVGDAFVLVCALFFAMHILVIDHFSPKTDGVKLSCIQFFVAGAICLVLMFIFEEVDPTALKAATLPILYSGVLSGGVAYTLQVVAQKDADPTIASMLLSLESVFSVIAGAIILGDIMSGREILGCAIMFAATILAQLPSKGQKSPLEKNAA